MKTYVLALSLAVFSPPALAQYNSNSNGGYGGYGTGSNPQSHMNSGYMRNNGTYVQPYHQTNPNGTTSDNYGTRGNYNPYTGQTGTRRNGF